MILNLYKARGETPLQCLERFRNTNPEYKEAKMSYLGRLDPMADGVLLIATDSDTSQTRREEIFGLDKDYDFSALFGFATDTHDCLGKITHTGSVDHLSEMDLIKLCNIYEGERDQKYPKYSSLRIDHPEIDPPSKKITIYKMQFKKLVQLSGKELFGRLLMDIGKVRGDFRQVEILELWQKNLKNSDSEYFIANFSASVSSGTYIRSIVNDLGETLGMGACALSITRTRVGNYLLKDSIRF